ncbi:Protein AC, partial [Clarias magur]
MDLDLDWGGSSIRSSSTEVPAHEIRKIGGISQSQGTLLHLAHLFCIAKGFFASHSLPPPVRPVDCPRPAATTLGGLKATL